MEKKNTRSFENNNFSPEFIEDNLKKEILYEKHKEDFLNKTDLLEKEIEDYYEENKDKLVKVRASHILVPTEEDGNKVLKNLKKERIFTV